MAMMAKKIQPTKTQAIASTKEVLSGFNDYIFVEYAGLTVAQITELRDKLREKSAVLKVFKNTFAKIAFEELKADAVTPYLTGPTAVALVKEDANEVAKIMFDFAKDVPALQIKGAWVQKELYDAAKIEAFSKLPGKKQLIAMIMSAINGPVQKIAATLQAYIDKKTEQGGSQ